MPQDQPWPRRPAPQGAGGLTSPPAHGTPPLAEPRPVARTLARHTLFSAVGEGSNVLLFLLGFLAARLLGPTPFGEYSTAFAFVGLFRILPDFGMSYASTLAISRDRSQAQRLVGGLLGFQAVLSLLTIALCLGIGATRYSGVTWFAVVVLAFDLVLKSVKSTVRWLLKGLERFGTEAVSLLFERALLLVLCLAVLYAGRGVRAFVLAFLVVRLLDTSALVAYVQRRVLPLGPHFDARLWADLLRKGLPFAYAGAMITLVFQVDTVILEKMRGATEVGWYRSPVLVLEGLTLVPRILGYALIPTMAAWALTRPEGVAELYRRGSKYLLLAGLPIGAFGLLESDRFIALLFGPTYAPSVAASKILLPAATFMFLSNFGETALACVSRWGTIVVVSTLALVLNVALNLAFIPRLGFVGAARATLITEALYFVATAAALRAYGYRADWIGIAWRPLLATAAFAAVLWVARPWPLVAASLAACAAYAAATVLLRVWDERERTLIADIVRGRISDPGRLAS
ncbi:MAG TPA: flippase [Vicinamibacteria bacterium]|nr:flippase [Vicinamibacteria bacterium]